MSELSPTIARRLVAAIEANRRALDELVALASAWRFQVSSGQERQLLAAAALGGARSVPVRLLHTFDEAGELLGVSPSTVQRLVRSGDLRAVTVASRTARIAEEDLLSYVERLRERSSSSSTAGPSAPPPGAGGAATHPHHERTPA